MQTNHRCAYYFSTPTAEIKICNPILHSRQVQRDTRVRDPSKRELAKRSPYKRANFGFNNNALDAFELISASTKDNAHRGKNPRFMLENKKKVRDKKCSS